METQKRAPRPRMTPSEINNIKRLLREGKTYEQIIAETGRSSHSIYNVSRRTRKKNIGMTSTSSAPVGNNHSADYWKAKYQKALALLIENDLIEVEF